MAHGGCFPIQQQMHGLAYNLVHGVTRAIRVLGISFRVAIRLLVHTMYKGGINTRDWAWERDDPDDLGSYR